MFSPSFDEQRTRIRNSFAGIHKGHPRKDLSKLPAERGARLISARVLCYKTVSTEPKSAGGGNLCNVIGR